MSNNTNIVSTSTCTCGRQKNSDTPCCNDCRPDFTNYVILLGLGYRDSSDKAKIHGIGPIGTCAICGRNYVFGGLNAFPVIADYDARCCSSCYEDVVMPACHNAYVKHHNLQDALIIHADE